MHKADYVTYRRYRHLEGVGNVKRKDWFGLDCGYIKEGAVADLSILDPQYFDNIVENVSEAPVEEFDNYMRLVNRNDDVVSQVLVGGEIIFEKNEFVEGYGKSKKYGRYLKHQPT